MPPDNPAPSTRDTRPSVLFTCIHNAGRSVAAEVLAEHYADGVVAVTSAGSEPEPSLRLRDDLHKRLERSSGEIHETAREPVRPHVGMPALRWASRDGLSRTIAASQPGPVGQWRDRSRRLVRRAPVEVAAAKCG